MLNQYRTMSKNQYEDTNSDEVESRIHGDGTPASISQAIEVKSVGQSSSDQKEIYFLQGKEECDQMLAICNDLQEIQELNEEDNSYSDTERKSTRVRNNKNQQRNLIQFVFACR